jgi:hypothetical protein
MQQFDREPQYTEANPGEIVIMPCRVFNKKGQCVWQKDGKVCLMFSSIFQRRSSPSSFHQNSNQIFTFLTFSLCVCAGICVCVCVEPFGPLRIRMNSPSEFTLGNTNGLAHLIWAIAAYGYPPPEPIWMPVNGNARYFLHNCFNYFFPSNKKKKKNKIKKKN